MFLRNLIAVAGTAAVVAVALPPASASALELSLKSPICGTVPGPGLHIDLIVSPTTSGFSATGTAVLCNATAIVSTIEMQFAGAGVNGSPIGGGPIVGAPFAIAYANTVSTTGSSTVLSSVNQTVLVNLSAQSVTVGAQFAANCQAVVELIAGSPYIVKGC